MPYEYHVTCKESGSKKKVAVELKDGLIAEILRRFAVENENEIILQQPFEDDWLDVEDVIDLNDSGKLRFIKKTIPVAAGDFVYQCLHWIRAVDGTRFLGYFLKKKKKV